jgi:hypothetical protein
MPRLQAKSSTLSRSFLVFQEACKKAQFLWDLEVVMSRWFVVATVLLSMSLVFFSLLLLT